MLDHYTIQKVEFLCSPQRPQDIFHSPLGFPNFLLPIPDLRLDKYVSYESIKEEIGESQEAINIDTEVPICTLLSTSRLIIFVILFSNRAYLFITSGITAILIPDDSCRKAILLFKRANCTITSCLSHYSFLLLFSEVVADSSP